MTTEQQSTPPPIPPGRYRLRPNGRWWNADELVVIWHHEQWCVVPAVAIAAMPREEAGDAA